MNGRSYTQTLFDSSVVGDYGTMGPAEMIDRA